MTNFTMKTGSIAACAALLISSAPAFAGGLGGTVVEAQPAAPQAMPASPTSRDYYVSLFAGGHAFSDVDTDFYGSEYTVEFDTGYVAGLTIGHRYNDTLRAEVELSFASADASSYSVRDGDIVYNDEDPAEGDLTGTYLLANVWYDIPTSGALGYYVGGGIGAAKMEADTTFDGAVYGYGPGETKFAAQLGGGLTYALSDQLALDAGYRFKYVGDVDFDDNDGEGVYEAADVQSHSLQVGLIYDF